MYRLPNFNALFQLVLAKFFKSELFLCSPKVDHMINKCKRPIIRISTFSVHLFSKSLDFLFLRVGRSVRDRLSSTLKNNIIVIIKFNCNFQVEAEGGL